MTGVRHHSDGLFHFEPKEFGTILLVSFIFAFILTFRMWGDGTFNVAIGLSNLIIVFIGLLTVLFLHEAGHKLVGTLKGYQVEIVPNKAGLVASGFVGLYFFGYVPFITPNLLELDARPERRMHKWYKHNNPRDAAVVAAGGIGGSSVAIIVFSTLQLLTGHELFGVILLGAFMHAVYSLIPFELLGLLRLRYFNNWKALSDNQITPSDGLHIWWFSAGAWIFALVFTIIFGLLALATGMTSYVISLVIAGICTWFFPRMMR